MMKLLNNAGNHMRARLLVRYFVNGMQASQPMGSKPVSPANLLEEVVRMRHEDIEPLPYNFFWRLLQVVLLKATEQWKWCVS